MAPDRSSAYTAYTTMVNDKGIKARRDRPTASTRVRNIDSPCRFVRRPHPQKGAAAVPEQSVTAPAHGGSRFTALADAVRTAAPI